MRSGRSGAQLHGGPRHSVLARAQASALGLLRLAPIMVWGRGWEVSVATVQVRACRAGQLAQVLEAATHHCYSACNIDPSVGVIGVQF